MVSQMEPPSDEELISRWRSRPGSEEGRQSVSELFQRHHSRVALWCLRIGGDRESAADLAQEVFLKAFESLEGFRGGSKFSTWLYTIARNHCYNHARASAAALAPMEESLEISLADETPDAYHRLERESSAEVFNGLVKESLTELETQAITLHYVEELPLDVVTRLLNLENQSGAKSYIVSARRKLARAMERWKAREQRVRP
jgi:RNA polymerase sigma-70 factor (ECF subfamily)